MRLISTIVLLTFIMLIASCGDDDNPISADDGSFSLTVNVLDQAGNPVENLQVAVWNDLEGLIELYPWGAAMTTIPFSLAEDGYVSIMAYNLRGELAGTVFEGPKAAGHYGVLWDGGEEPDGVYACIMSVTNAGTTQELFADTMFAALRRASGPGLGILSPLGYTNVSGDLVTYDPLLFPNVLDLPVMNSTNGVVPITLAPNSRQALPWAKTSKRAQRVEVS